MHSIAGPVSEVDEGVGLADRVVSVLCRQIHLAPARSWRVAAITFEDLDPSSHDEVRRLILVGLGQHWSVIDESLNSDLDDMLLLRTTQPEPSSAHSSRVLGPGAERCRGSSPASAPPASGGCQGPSRSGARALARSDRRSDPAVADRRTLSAEAR